MATPTLLVAALIVGALLFALLIRGVGRQTKRDAPADDDSPFADLIAKNRAEAGALPSASQQPAPRSESESTAASSLPRAATAGHPFSSFAQLEPLLLADLQAGQKITAIKRLREATGLGLKAAKEAVEQLHATGRLQPDELVAHPPAPTPPSPQRSALSLGDPAVAEQARAFLARGQKIQAIKAVREMTDVGLKEAKDFVERL